MRAVIIRRTHNTSYGTFGVLSLNEMPPCCLTLEEEWLNNQPNISCIPAGVYTIRRHDSPKYGDVFKVMNVPGRSHILIHWGNISDHTEGCILLGESFEPVLGTQGVVSSKSAFDEFMKSMDDVDEARLIIVDDWKNPLTEEH